MLYAAQKKNTFNYIQVNFKNSLVLKISYSLSKHQSQNPELKPLVQNAEGNKPSP